MEQWKFWTKTDPTICLRIKKLLEDMRLHPYSGIGKPEALKYSLSGKWSRRINACHRLVYSVHEDKLEILVLTMRYHYGDK